MWISLFMSQSQPPFSFLLVSSNLIFHCYWFHANSFFIVIGFQQPSFYCYWFPVISFFIVIGFQQPPFFVIGSQQPPFFVIGFQQPPFYIVIDFQQPPFILLLVSTNLIYHCYWCLVFHYTIQKILFTRRMGGIYSDRSIAIFSSNRQMMGTDEHSIHTGWSN